MDDYGDLFDGKEPAKAARDEALHSVTENSGDWINIALGLIEGSIPVHSEMTGEQLRLKLRELGLPRPHHHNAWGGMVSSAIKRKLLIKTGRYSNMATVRSHARETPILRRVG